MNADTVLNRIAARTAQWIQPLRLWAVLVLTAVPICGAAPGAQARGLETGATEGSAIEARRDYKRPGLYIGLGTTVALEDFDVPKGVDASSGSSFGGYIVAGYRLSRVVAAELQLESYETIDWINQGLGLQGWSLTSNARLYPFPWDRVQPYVVFGIGVLKAERFKDSCSGSYFENSNTKCRGPSRTAFLSRVGGGIDFYATRHIVINVQAAYARPGSPLDRIRFAPIGLGMQYRF